MTKTFAINGVTYTQTEKGYCYKTTGTFDKKGNELTRRIPKHVFEQAFDEYIKTKQDDADWEAQANAEIEARNKAQAEEDRKTEQNFNKKTTTKKRKSKDVAHESGGVTLTAKQVDFLKALPGISFWDHGIDSALWCDCIAGDIGWNPMSVGAMISTLREKHLIFVNIDNTRKGKPKYMEFTELGKQVAKELGLA